MTTLTAPLFRAAREADLPAIIAMLADDRLGAGREDISEAARGPYLAAFREIAADPNQMLVIMEQEGESVGTCQITIIPGISQRGLKRGQIEGVRVSASRRGSGLGAALIRFAIEECRKRGCGSVQLTSNKSRTDAIRFYERLGFKASHEGLKFDLA